MVLFSEGSPISSKLASLAGESAVEPEQAAQEEDRYSVRKSSEGLAGHEAEQVEKQRCSQGSQDSTRMSSRLSEEVTEALYMYYIRFVAKLCRVLREVAPLQMRFVSRFLVTTLISIIFIVVLILIVPPMSSIDDTSHILVWDPAAAILTSLNKFTNSRMIIIFLAMIYPRFSKFFACMLGVDVMCFALSAVGRGVLPRVLIIVLSYDVALGILSAAWLRCRYGVKRVVFAVIGLYAIELFGRTMDDHFLSRLAAGEEDQQRILVFEVGGFGIIADLFVMICARLAMEEGCLDAHGAAIICAAFEVNRAVLVRSQLARLRGGSAQQLRLLFLMAVTEFCRRVVAPLLQSVVVRRCQWLCTCRCMAMIPIGISTAVGVVSGTADGVSAGVGEAGSGAANSAVTGGVGGAAAALEEETGATSENKTSLQEFRMAKLMMSNVAEMNAIVLTSVLPALLWPVWSLAFMLEAPTAESLAIDIGCTIALEVVVDLCSLVAEEVSDQMASVVQGLRRSRSTCLLCLWMALVPFHLLHELRIGDFAEACPLENATDWNVSACDGFAVHYADGGDACVVCCGDPPDHYIGREYFVEAGPEKYWLPELCEAGEVQKKKKKGRAP